MSGVDSGRERAAREVLHLAIAALDALGMRNFVLVGAQAVYLRAPHPLPNLAPYTYDADVLADVRFVRRAEVYDRLISGGFELRSRMPGLYKLASEPKGSGYELDILVPERGMPMDEADYAGDGLRAVNPQPGLEICVLDNSPFTLQGLSDADPGPTLRVANVTALVIAKSFKIGERFGQGPEAFEEVGKDVGDIFRLLSSGSADEYAKAIRALGPDAYLHETVATGVGYLERLCSRGGEGVDLLGRMLGEDLEAQSILERFPILVDEFCSTVTANASSE